METPRYTNEQVIGLVRNAAGGDGEAFSAVYKSYYSPLYRYIYFRVGHEEDTEDLVRSVFLRACTAIARSETGDKNPFTYFYAAARNAVDDYWRRKKEFIMRDGQDMAFGGAMPDVSVEETGETNETARQVLSGMLHLTPDQQEAMIYRFINVYPMHDIAEIMGTTERAVRTLQGHALKTLRKFMRADNILAQLEEQQHLEPPSELLKKIIAGMPDLSMGASSAVPRKGWFSSIKGSLFRLLKG